MIFQSIKRRLQAWHALLLVAVLAGFGFTAWRLESVGRLQRIDRDLEQRAQVLLSALRKGGPPGPGERPPGPGFGEPDDGGPPPEGRPERGARRGPPISERELSLFGGSGTNACYFVLWHRDGAVIMKSPNTPGEVPRPARGAPIAIGVFT